MAGTKIATHASHTAAGQSARLVLQLIHHPLRDLRAHPGRSLDCIPIAQCDRTAHPIGPERAHTTGRRVVVSIKLRLTTSSLPTMPTDPPIT